VVGEEARDDFDHDTLEPVLVQQGAGGVSSRDTGMIRDQAVAPEDRPDQTLNREPEQERSEQEEPDCGAHEPALAAGSRMTSGISRSVRSWYSR
jgi:hypothetical protein